MSGGQLIPGYAGDEASGNFQHLVVNDPWGEPDLVSGATLNANGMGLRFSRRKFGRRWMVGPIGGGAYRYAPGKGWAVEVGGVVAIHTG